MIINHTTLRAYRYIFIYKLFIHFYAWMYNMHSVYLVNYMNMNTGKAIIYY